MLDIERIKALAYIYKEYEGGWTSDRGGEWQAIEESEVPTDLVPLVKGTRG